MVGKGPHQFDLPLGERLDPHPVKRDNAGADQAEQRAVPAQRHHQLGPHARKFREAAPARYLVIRSRFGRRSIRVVGEGFAGQQPPMVDVGEVGSAQHCCELLRVAMGRDRSEMLAVIAHHGTHGGATEAVRLLQDRLEHRPRVAG